MGAGSASDQADAFEVRNRVQASAFEDGIVEATSRADLEMARPRLVADMGADPLVGGIEACRLVVVDWSQLQGAHGPEQLRHLGCGAIPPT